MVVMVPNYQAGKDAAHGFSSRYKGEIVDEIYVPLTQLDFSAELARIASEKPDAVFTFMPGSRLSSTEPFVRRIIGISSSGCMGSTCHSKPRWEWELIAAPG